MSSILAELGLDQSTLQWHDLANCKNLDSELFYDKYENDSILAKNVDQICLHCPVIAQCYRTGRKNKEIGVWGGVYLDNGRPDKNKNRHKTNKVWLELEKRGVQK